MEAAIKYQKILKEIQEKTKGEGKYSLVQELCHRQQKRLPQRDMILS